MTGRPRAELTPARRRGLEKVAARVAAAEAKLAYEREGLAEIVRVARDEGASFRAIGEAIGLTAPSVIELLARFELLDAK